MLTAGLAIVLITLAGLMAAIRLAPVDVAQWHQPLSALAQSPEAPAGEVIALEGGARLRILAGTLPPQELLAKLDTIAMASPRTRRVAGSAADGRITWETRSLFWGFPDYTTAEAQADGVILYARLRFGRRDFGVNAARLKEWLARIN
ncbi:MAG: DUF1499 domain-containing protein [Alphaproteobacteria bacterium]|nr:DUF1499 domain-containing protein [Alphaproteobacteria bacterium]